MTALDITDDEAIRLIFDAMFRRRYSRLTTLKAIEAERGGGGGPLYLEDRGTLYDSDDPKPSHAWSVNFFTPQYVEARLSESWVEGDKRHWEFKWTRKQFHNQVVKHLAAAEENVS